MDIYEVYQRPERRGAQHRNKFRAALFGDFDCCHCRLRVSAEPLLSGVNHRNHCPYCLWSKHVDLRESGDRLCACKSPMEPVGLTFKRARKKYQPAQPGELMLVHQCAACGALSVNRIAADDGPARLWVVFEASPAQTPGLAVLAERDGIELLSLSERELVRAALRVPDLCVNLP